MRQARQRMFDDGGRVRSTSAKNAAVPLGTKREISMTRSILTLSIVLLFAGNTAWAQLPASQNPPQQSKPPVQPGQCRRPCSPARRRQIRRCRLRKRRSRRRDSRRDRIQRSRIVSRTSLVIVPVTVKNRDGALIGDLQQNEFRVFCDNVEQQIVYFTSDPFPLSAVVLIDNHLSIKSGRAGAEEPHRDFQRIWPRTTKWRW